MALRRTELRRTGGPKRTPFRRRPPEPTDDEPFLIWIRTRPCSVCGAEPPSEASHCGIRGGGQKCSDAIALPHCKTCHDAWHGARFLDRLRECGWYKVVDIMCWVEEESARQNREYGRYLARREAAPVF